MRSFACALIVTSLFAMAACSGGGGTASTSSAPQPTVGEGTNALFNQRITFSIVVPSATAGSSKNRMSASVRRRFVRAASPAPTTPYVSPATAAIVLTLAEVNGVSPQKAPPPIAPIPVTCQGCTFRVPNVPAALGVDRYFVQTYSGYSGGQATGNLISTGFVDVAVPVTKTPAIGGAAALSIGGYVAQINLSPASVTFAPGVPGDANVLLSALDAGGATIIGSVEYASPIVVSVASAQSFSVDSAASVSIGSTRQQSFDLHYTGGNSLGTLVLATSQNENGQAVNASPVTAFVGVAPTPTPTLPPGASPTPRSSPTPPPSPSPTAAPPSPTPPPPQTSLYVADAAADTVSEYAFVAQLEAGHIPNPLPTPKRVMQFKPSLILNKIPTLACTASPFSNATTGNGTEGLTLSGNGSIFTFPTCFDGTNTYVFGFPATSVGPVAPTIIDPINTNSTGLGPAIALAYSPIQGTVFAEFQEYENVFAGFSAQSNGQQPSSTVGSACYQEFAQPPCSLGEYSFQTGYSPGFGLDAYGYAYLPASWVDQATGDAQFLTLPPAMLTIPVSVSSSATVPFSAIAGLFSLAGGTGSPPVAAAIDGNNLYVLTGGASLVSADGNTNYYPGLSNCPAPSPNAPVNTIFDPNNPNGPTPPSLCQDGYLHLYLNAYTITSLLGPGSYGQDVDLVPNFVLGGDIVGGFGCSYLGGQFVAASAGFVYIINQQTNCNNNPAPEIDVYDTNGLGGAHTDIAPVVKINLATSFPSAIVIGPSGSVTGGQAILRLPHKPGFRSARYHWPAKRRRPLSQIYHFRAAAPR